TQCRASQNCASFSSSSATSGPSTNWQCASTASSRRRNSGSIRFCCALRSRNGTAGWVIAGENPSCARGDRAVRVVLELRHQAAEQLQREAGLLAATGGGDLVERAADDRWVGGAGARHQEAGKPGRHRRLATVEQLLEELFARPQPREADLHVVVGAQSGKPDHL